MNSFQRKSLYAALAGVGALGVTGAADAVNVNPNGLGQVLIYPYYTVNTDGRGNAFNSLISVVNSTGSAKSVKVRFLEGKDSREVLDFNLFLSKHDVWTAAVIPSTTTAGGAVITGDQSCTIPPNSLLQAGVDFVNFAYTGSASDGGDPGLDRTKEGYVEMIEMSTFPTNTCTYIEITHVNGVPKDCAHVTDSKALADSRSASGGLFGEVQIINVDSGGDYDTDAVALERFNTTVGGIYNFANSVLPQLTNVFPKTSVTFGNPNFSGDLGVYVSNWPTPTYFAVDPVSATLMHDSVLNEFVLDANTKSGTDWVVTFPTKRFYVLAGTGAALKLFQRNFNDSAGSCDDVSLNIYNREEGTTSTPTTFSPPPPTLTNSICWEANVITFNNSNVFGSQNSANLNTGFQNGWLQLGFATPPTGLTYHTLINTTNTTHFYGGPGNTSNNLTAGETKTYVGLPVVGFAAVSYTNGALLVNGTTVLANYGSKFAQKATTLIHN